MSTVNKNGTYFVSIIDGTSFSPTLWDPFAYKNRDEEEPLSNYVSLRRVETQRIPYGQTRFHPIEYRNFPGNDYLSFALCQNDDAVKRSVPAVAEQTILFGTMRAYLGNIAVTPDAAWVGCDSPLFYETKSEFVSIHPRDGLSYFWMAYLRSHHFLQCLPLGGGGTRPRLDLVALEIIPVSVPDLHTRQTVHDRLKKLAKSEWEIRMETKKVITEFILVP